MIQSPLAITLATRQINLEVLRETLEDVGSFVPCLRRVDMRHGGRDNPVRLWLHHNTEVDRHLGARNEPVCASDTESAYECRMLGREYMGSWR